MYIKDFARTFLREQKRELLPKIPLWAPITKLLGRLLFEMPTSLKNIDTYKSCLRHP